MNIAFNLARQCPRFLACSVNRCPLAAGYPKQFVDRHDKEKRCAMEKGVRRRIAAKYPGQLANGGLTAREAAGKRVFNQLPLAVKSHLVEMGKVSLAKIHKGKEVHNG
jgi:hypothetical protein